MYIKKLNYKLKHKIHVFGVLIVCIMMFSVGFANFSQVLNINMSGRVVGINPIVDYYYNNGYFYTDEACGQDQRVINNGAPVTALGEMFSLMPANSTLHMMSTYNAGASETAVTNTDITVKRYNHTTNASNNNYSLFTVSSGNNFTIYANTGGSVTFDGNNITMNSNILGGMFNNSGTLTIGDNASGEHNITLINNISCGGAVYNAGTLQMKNSIITGNSTPNSGKAADKNTTYIAGIHNIASGTCNLNNVTIEKNTSKDSSTCGVGLHNKGTLNVSGMIVVQNNKNSLGNNGNVFLLKNLYINVVNTLASGSAIGVTVDSKNANKSVNIATGSAIDKINDVRYFFSDSVAYNVGYSAYGNYITLDPA